MSSSCFAVTTEGKLWAWGYGDMGQLGTGLEEDENVPVNVTETSKKLTGKAVVQVGAGGQHTVILVADEGVDLKYNADGAAAAAAAPAAGGAGGKKGGSKKRTRDASGSAE